MELKLKNINLYGENKQRVVISIEARYGWNEKTYGDLIKISFDSTNINPSISVKIKNQGVAFVIERIIECLSEIDFPASNGTPLSLIIKTLAKDLKMAYDEENIQDLI